MKKLWQALLWLMITSATILTSAIIMKSLAFESKSQTLVQEEALAKIALDSAVPQGEVKGMESSVELADGRAAIVANFLAKYNSPLKPYDHYGQVLVDIADKYELDFRFLPAIMMEESNLCKNIPEGTYNCLGFGIHAKGTLGFDSYEAGFERAAKELRANYVEQGRIQVSAIASKYTASVDKWTNSVNQWMAEMKYDDRNMGIEKKTDTNVLEYVKSE